MREQAEDDLSLEEMSDEQLAMEAADLRSNIEAINLDLLDDAKGGFWRAEQWRIRARGARAYIQSDLNAANAAIIARRKAREIIEIAARREDKVFRKQEKADNRAYALAAMKENKVEKVKARAHQLQMAEIALQQDREKTKRHRADLLAKESRYRKLVKAFREHYSAQDYADLLVKAGLAGPETS